MGIRNSEIWLFNDMSKIIVHKEISFTKVLRFVKAPSESISPHFADEGWQSPLLHLETLFHTGDSEVSVDLTVQAANLLSEKFSSQAKKLINLSKNTVQSALEIQQRIVMPSSENSECFFLQLFHSISV